MFIEFGRKYKILENLKLICMKADYYKALQETIFYISIEIRLAY